MSDITEQCKRVLPETGQVRVISLV